MNGPSIPRFLWGKRAGPGIFYRRLRRKRVGFSHREIYPTAILDPDDRRFSCISLPSAERDTMAFSGFSPPGSASRAVVLPLLPLRAGSQYCVNCALPSCVKTPLLNEAFQSIREGVVEEHLFSDLLPSGCRHKVTRFLVFNNLARLAREDRIELRKCSNIYV